MVMEASAAQLEGGSETDVCRTRCQARQEPTLGPSQLMRNRGVCAAGGRGWHRRDPMLENVGRVDRAVVLLPSRDPRAVRSG